MHFKRKRIVSTLLISSMGKQTKLDCTFYLSVPCSSAWKPICLIFLCRVVLTAGEATFECRKSTFHSATLKSKRPSKRKQTEMQSIITQRNKNGIMLLVGALTPVVCFPSRFPFASFVDNKSGFGRVRSKTHTPPTPGGGSHGQADA